MDRINILAENLRNKGYDVQCFESRNPATDFLDERLDRMQIGIGGSKTVEEMKLYEILCHHNTVYWHDRKPEELTVMETRQAAFRADVYISSVNAISLDGCIVNIDATGNRVAAISFGPGEIYLIIGKNKITENLDDAIYRARNVAAPLNARRLNRKTPCAVNADKCYDCNSPERICRNFSIIKERPFGSNYHIILINENLGY